MVQARAGTPIQELLRRMPYTLHVGNVPGGRAEFTSIQVAVNYATAQGGTWTILVYPGTYTEQVVLSPSINLVGIDKESVILQVAGGQTAITMAQGCYVANLTLNVTADAVGDGIGIELNDAACTIHDLIINLTRTANTTYAILENTGGTARTIYIRNVRISSADINTRGIYTTRANKIIYIENCWVDCYRALVLDGVSIIYSDHNLWDGALNSITISAGTIQMTEDTVLGGAVQQTGGTCTYRDSHDTYHVFLGMYIQDALTAGAGGEVVIHAGTHEPPNPVAPGPALTVSANTLVRGQGFGAIIQGDGAAANITNLLLLNGNNIHIKDIKLVLEAGCGTAGARPNVIYATGRTLIWLENLWIVGDTSVADDGSDARQCGVYFNNVDESKIVDCRIEDNVRHSINLSYGSSDNTLSGNTCQGNSLCGIYLLDSNNNNTLSGNTCQGNSLYGIYLLGSSNNTLSGNTCQGNGLYGIHIYANSNNNTVTGNTCQGNSSGILLDSSSNNTITGNTCQGNGFGLQLLSSLNNTVTGNTCQGNTNRGILLVSSSNNTITGNTCQGNTNFGLQLSSSSNNNTITGNTCQGNGNGIYISRSSYCVISGNNCSGQTVGDGINITGDATTNSDYNTLTGNVCTNNASDGIEIAGGDNANKNIVLGNQLLGNTANPLVDNGTNTTIAHNVTV